MGQIYLQLNDIVEGSSTKVQPGHASCEVEGASSQSDLRAADTDMSIWKMHGHRLLDV